MAKARTKKDDQDDLKLVGLLNDVVLPGEERELASPALDTSVFAALAARPPKRLCVVGITSPSELPAMVTARWATECEVVACEPARLVVRGVRRVRIVAARGASAPYGVELEGAAADGQETSPASVIAGAHALFAALETTKTAGDTGRLEAAIAGIVRTFAPGRELPEFLRLPPGEALNKLARSLAAGAEAHRASCRLEEELVALAAKPQIDEATRRRLWSEVVQVMRRLDVFDPATLDEPQADLARLQQRLQQAGLPRDVREVAKRELRLLRSMKADHHDYATYMAHLDFIARLAWHPEPLREVRFDDVAAALERDHAGLDKPKRRILEHLAVRVLGGAARSTIVCLAGPPGVGKTSVARAIAAALGRKFVRVALGGIHEEAEIRGHRLSFVAAAPGRLLGGIARVSSATPVVLLDEIDKIGTDRTRSPAAALLEALDPEQHAHFYDNYLGVPYDLSHCLFLCTANDLSEVSDALRDRLEAIEIDGYSVKEKIAIARSHLLPKLCADTGLPRPLAIADDTLGLVVEGYTREAGVRQLKRSLESVYRARALTQARAPGSATSTAGADRAAQSADAPSPTDDCDAKEVERALGPARYSRAILPHALPVGVALGLAVGAEGGTVLFVEVASMPGKGELRLTGRLGEVMREAAQAAIALLRSDPARFGVDPARLACDFHVHVPDGATPKEGPSAGVALFCALLSAATGRPARADVAMTGELTLSGRVLPVGGVRAKVLAAERAGVRLVIVPDECRADVPTDTTIEIAYVRELHEAIEVVFASPDPAGVAPAPSEGPRLTEGAPVSEPEVDPLVDADQIREIADQAHDILVAALNEGDDPDHPGSDRLPLAFAALAFCARAAQELENTSLFETIADPFSLLVEWDSSYHEDPDDVMGSAIADLLAKTPRLGERAIELASDTSPKVRCAIARGLRPAVPGAMALLRKLVADVDSHVRAAAKESLGDAAEAPWWTGLLPVDPVTLVGEVAAARVRPVLEEILAKVSVPWYEKTKAFPAVVKLVRRLPRPLGAIVAERALLVADHAAEEDIGSLAKLMLAGPGAEAALHRLLASWSEGISSYAYTKPVGDAIARLPMRRRTDLCRRLAKNALSASEGERLLYGSGATLAGTFAARAWPKALDYGFVLDGIDALEREDDEHDMAISSLAELLKRVSPRAAHVPRLVEQLTRPSSKSWRELHRQIAPHLAKLPAPALRPIAERAAASAELPAIRWGLEMLASKARAPGDPPVDDLLRGWVADARLLPAVAASPELRAKALPWLRDKLRTRELGLDAAVHVILAAGAGIGGAPGLAPAPPEQRRVAIEAEDWAAYRAIRDAAPLEELDLWAWILAALPPGPRQPEDRALLRRAIEAVRHDRDLDHWVSCALRCASDEASLADATALIAVTSGDDREQARKLRDEIAKTLGVAPPPDPAEVVAAAAAVAAVAAPGARAWIDEPDE